MGSLIFIEEAREEIEKFETGGMTKEALSSLDNAVSLLDDLYGMHNDESQIAKNILNCYFSRAKTQIERLLMLDILPDERQLKYWYIVLRKYKGIEAVDQKVFTDLLDKIHPVVKARKYDEYRNLSPKKLRIEIAKINDVPEDF